MSSFGGVGGVGRIDVEGDWLLSIAGDPEVDPTGNGAGYTFRFALAPRLDGYYLLISELDRSSERLGGAIGIGADATGVTLSNVPPDQARQAVALVHEGVAAFNSELQRERAERVAGKTESVGAGRGRPGRRARRGSRGSPDGAPRALARLEESCSRVGARTFRSATVRADPAALRERSRRHAC